MTQYAAVTAQTITGSSITDDKKHGILHFRDPTGAEAVLAIPAEELPKLIEGAAKCHSDIIGHTKMKEGEVQAFETSWFEVRKDEITGRFLVLITFGAGGTIAFALQEAMPEQIYEIFGSMLGRSTPAPTSAKN